MTHDPWMPRVIWRCPEAGCEYRLNEAGPPSTDPALDEDFRLRAIAKAQQQHASMHLFSERGWE